MFNLQMQQEMAFFLITVFGVVFVIIGIIAMFSYIAKKMNSGQSFYDAVDSDPVVKFSVKVTILAFFGWLIGSVVALMHLHERYGKSKIN